MAARCARAVRDVLQKGPGVVAREMRNVKADTHADDVLATLRFSEGVTQQELAGRQVTHP